MSSWEAVPAGWDCHTLAGPWSLPSASQGCCGWGGGSTGRCFALQKGLGWGRCSNELGERCFSHKDPSPSVLTAEECWPIQSAALPLPGTSPSTLKSPHPAKDEDNSKHRRIWEKRAWGNGRELDRTRQCHSSSELCRNCSRAGRVSC